MCFRKKQTWLAENRPQLHSIVRFTYTLVYCHTRIPISKVKLQLTQSNRWFAVNMGTGIVSILLHNLPWNGHWLHIISYIFFALNILLFAIFFTISLLRYTLYPEIWFAMIAHPAQSLFLGCFPMGFASKSSHPSHSPTIISKTNHHH